MNKWKSNKILKMAMGIVSFLTAAAAVCSLAAVILIASLGVYDYSDKEALLKERYEAYSLIYTVMAMAGRESPVMQEEINKTNFRYGIIRDEDSGAEGDLDPNEIKISDPQSYEYYNFEAMPGKDALEKGEAGAERFVVGNGTRYSWECSLFGYGHIYREEPDDAYAELTEDVEITGYYYNVADGIFYYETDEEFYRVDEVMLPVGKNGERLVFRYDSGQGAYYNIDAEACLVEDYYLTFSIFDDTERSWQTWDEIGLDGLIFEHTGIRFANDENSALGEFQGKPIAGHYYSYGDGDGILSIRMENGEEAKAAQSSQDETYWVIYQVRDPLQATGIRNDFLDGDLFEQITFLVDNVYAWRYTAIVALIILLILWGASTVLVLIMAGHKGSYEMVEVPTGAGGFGQEEALALKEGEVSAGQGEAELPENREAFVRTESRWVDTVKPGFFQKIPWDVGTCAIVVLGGILIAIAGESFYYTAPVWSVIWVAVCGAACYVLGYIWLVDFAIRIKAGKWWRGTLTYKPLAWIFRKWGKAWQKIKGAFRFLQENIALLWKAILILGGISLVECFVIALTGFEPEVELCIWFLYRTATLILIMIGIVQADKLREGAKKLADGELQEKISTEKMFWEFRKHGENLNSIHDGISLAVEKRMQSEHFRTELITNVSHDIKTPLTSIINYVDLLQKEEIDNEKAKEYLEVLSRQSARLKKLTEDLIEASKASTGSMPVHMEKLELGVFLTQTVGEFEEKLSASGLRVVMHKPEREVFVNADGRHLWRVVENLVQNICKYAQPDTRVYIDLDEREKEAIISFKNISRYELNISGDELMERFVRGDESRHTDGSGLGLSIAGSLMELMRGKLEIVVDGDLFKVVLHFPR